MQPAPAHVPEGEHRSAIEASGLGVRFGRHWALAHVDLALEPGSATLLMGANGSGKTTLLRLLCGLLRPTTGTLRVLGRDPSSEPFQVRPRVTLVSHRTFLYESLTASEHVALWAGLGRRRLATSVAALLDSVGLAQRADEPVSTFSAGMRKRLTLLRTRIEEPEVVLLDEPFSALDPEGQEMMEHWLAEITAQGRTLVLASHAVERARALCSAALVLRSGQIVWRGPADAASPALSYTSRRDPSGAGA